MRGVADRRQANATACCRRGNDASGEDLHRTVDGTNERSDIVVCDVVFSSLGNGTNNNLTAVLFCYDSDTTGGNDTNIIPCTQHDFILTTQGTDVTVQVANFFRAS